MSYHRVFLGVVVSCHLRTVTEEAFVDGSCSSCGDMTISELHNRLRYVKHGGVALSQSSVRPGTASGGVRGDLRITVRASPSGAPYPSSTPQPVGQGAPHVPFGAPSDVQIRSSHRRASPLSPWMMTLLRCPLRVW